MDPKRSEAVSEGVNALCLFLCGPTYEGLKADAPALLAQWAAEYAPVLRDVDVPPALRGAFRAALERLVAIAGAGFDPDAADRVRELRAPIREVLTALRLPLPAPASPGAKVCELHGKSCPVIAPRGR
jgi:hypothetical protein